MTAVRIIVFILFILYIILLELSSNRLAGLIAGGFVFAGFIVLGESRVLDGQPLLQLLAWFLLFGLLALIYILTAPPEKRVKAFNGSKKYTAPVSTAAGDFIGVLNRDDSVELFAGIPYAKPPVGELRWKEPQDPDKLEEPLLCDRFGPMAMQKRSPNLFNNIVQIAGYHDYVWFDLSTHFRAANSEDCLYINIWRPSGADAGDKLPVLIYVHGGSLQTGQPWYEDYSGENLAKEGVIVVNMGYRLGVYGFLALSELKDESPNHTTGNYGLLDQIKAIKWVHDNIKDFGGDTDNITLAGESAGAASVSALMASPLAKGLFNRIILESSTVASKEPPHSFRSLDDALISGQKIFDKYNVHTVSELRMVPSYKLTRSSDTEHHITVDGYALIKTPYEAFKEGDMAGSAILHGFNEKEIVPFIIFQKADLKNFEEKVSGYFGSFADDVLKLYAPKTDVEASFYWEEIYGSVFFDYSHYCLNRLAVKNGIPVYEYFFSKDNKRIGCWHSGEQVYFYRNIPDGSRLYDQSDRALMDQMSSVFINYIKTGDIPEKLPSWEQNNDSVSYMQFGSTSGMIKERERKIALFGILDRMQGWSAENGINS